MNEIQQLENKLKDLRMEEWRKKQADQATRKSNFLAKNKHDVYHASDYAGMSSSGVSFYYGYESTSCKKHGNEYCDCDESEWCFTATHDSAEVMRIPKSKLWYENGEEPMFYLLCGIAIYMNKKD